MSINRVKSPVSTEIVRSITVRLLQRIESLHNAGILHLDINPSYVHVNITSQDDIEVGLSSLMFAQARDRQNHFEWAGACLPGQNYWPPENLLQVLKQINAAKRG
jgi:serine/threonine protein kinase